MCDTFVALSNSTGDGSVIFGKNSDRDANEAHEIIMVPRQEHGPYEKVQCTYIVIPQVRTTNAVLLAKPFWIWGAEMGANEHGVVIGNEAIFSKVSAGKEPGLIGMDYLRLALERADNARGALDVITTILAEYGQSGNCGFDHPLYYHNSFLIADPAEAWVLETVDRHWAALRVKDFHSISNVITIEKEFDLASDDLVSYAVQKGWCKHEKEFSFRDCYSDLIMTWGSDSVKRQLRTTCLLGAQKGKMDLSTAMQMLRDHGEDSHEAWNPDGSLMGAQVCMHASAGPVRISQTTGSMVSSLKPGEAVHWLTGTAAPCTSIFKPYWLDTKLPDMGNRPKGTYDADSLWWQHEDLHREVLKDYAHRLNLYRSERDQLESEFLLQAESLTDKPVADCVKFSQACSDKALQATNRWLQRVQGAEIQKGSSLLHRMTWRSYDKKAER